VVRRLLDSLNEVIVEHFVIVIEKILVVVGNHLIELNYLERIKENVYMECFIYSKCSCSFSCNL
jgi:hypothetical protein